MRFTRKNKTYFFFSLFRHRCFWGDKTVASGTLRPERRQRSLWPSTAKLEGHSEDVTSVALSPDGKTIFLYLLLTYNSLNSSYKDVSSKHDSIVLQLQDIQTLRSKIIRKQNLTLTTIKHKTWVANAKHNTSTRPGIHMNICYRSMIISCFNFRTYKHYAAGVQNQTNKSNKDKSNNRTNTDRSAAK